MIKRTFSREFKLQVARQLARGEKRIAQVCREYGLCQTLVRRWRDQYETAGENAWLNQQEAATARAARARSATFISLPSAHPWSGSGSEAGPAG